MHYLKVFTELTKDPDVFIVHWTNSSIRPKGEISVTIHGRFMDRKVIAELRALQYLLEDKCVLGEHLAGGQSTTLVVSNDAIEDLMHGKSEKLHLTMFSNFLRTRFSGCPIEVSQDNTIFASSTTLQMDELLVTSPHPETLSIPGLGNVTVTRHVLERLGIRLPSLIGKAPAQTWKKLQEMVTDIDIREVVRRNRSQETPLNSDTHRDKGRYFLCPKLKMILVVSSSRGNPTLVTAYPAHNRFGDFPMAA